MSTFGKSVTKLGDFAKEPAWANFQKNWDTSPYIRCIYIYIITADFIMVSSSQYPNDNIVEPFISISSAHPCIIIAKNSSVTKCKIIT